MMSKMLKGHGFCIIATGDTLSVDILRNREVTSVTREQFKGRPETKQSQVTLGKLLSLSLPHPRPR